MGADPGPFQIFYESGLQHPGLLWVAALAGLAVALSRPGLSSSVRRYVGLLALLSVLDAWLTSNDVLLLGSLGGASASLVPLAFVLLGDFRYLLVLTSASADGRLAWRAKTVGIAAGMTTVVPVASQLIVGFLPEGLWGGRALFLIYEILFALGVVGLIRWHPNARDVAWVRSVSRFVLTYYVLWAAADLLIIAAGDVGFLLRVVPNVLYYGGLLGAIGWCASRAATRWA